MDQLNVKQRMFVAEYLIDLNATAAYKRAGYTGEGHVAESSASEILRNPEVASAVKEAMDKRSESLGIDAKYVLETIKDTVERCRQAKPVKRSNGDLVYVETEDGEVLPAYTFDSQAVLKGAELLGKHLKMWTYKVETKIDGVVIVKASDLDEKL